MSSTHLPADKVAVASLGAVAAIELSREEILFGLYKEWSQKRAWWRTTPRYTRDKALRLLPDYFVVIVEQHQAEGLLVAGDLLALANAALELLPNAAVEVSATDFAVIHPYWRK